MSWPSDSKSVQLLFVAAWVLMLVASMIFSRTASPATKDKWRLPASLFAGVVFLGFITWLDGRRAFLFAVLPVLAIIWLNYRFIRVCSHCGAMNRNPYMYPLPKFCQKCGAALDESGRVR